jgi:two-component system, LytTR family, response regulator
MDNKKIKIIIIDDEQLARSIIKKYLEPYQDIEIAAECANGFEGIKAVNELSPDLIFLDIQMPKLTGFEMLELLDKKPAIIFTTAFDQYAIKAFEVNAVDYLLKPFPQARLDEALKKAKAQIESAVTEAPQIENLIRHNEANIEYIDRIIIKDGSKISIVQTDSIKCIEAQDDYVMVYSDEGKFLKQKTMKFFEDHLNPKEFIRIHRSYIVKIQEIKQIELLEKESYQVKLKDGKTLPVSKNGYSRLKVVLSN